MMDAAKMPTTTEVAAYDTAAVQVFAKEVIRLDSASVALLGTLGITGRSVLVLGASWVDHLEKKGMTTGDAIILTQAVEELRGAFTLCVSTRRLSCSSPPYVHRRSR